MRLVSEAVEQVLKFNRGKFRVLHLWRNNPRHQHKLGADLLGSNSGEKDLAVLVDNKSQQCPGGQEGQRCPGVH